MLVCSKILVAARTNSDDSCLSLFPFKYLEHRSDSGIAVTHRRTFQQQHLVSLTSDIHVVREEQTVVIS